MCQNGPLDLGLEILPTGLESKVCQNGPFYTTVDIFKMTFLNVLNKFAPLKKKHLRANHSRFANKELNEAIMQVLRLRKEYLKNKTRTTRIACNKQKKCMRQHSA